jgi:hypothetical protein
MHSCLYAQIEDFEQVFKACVLAQSSQSFGEGSQAEIEEAAHMLANARWIPLVLQHVDTKYEVPIKKHLVFSPEFLKDVAVDRSVYKRAKMYQEEQMAPQRGVSRGGDVFLCTKCIKAGKKVVYALRTMGGKTNVAAVAEVNGLINLSVVVKDEKGNMSKTYKTTSEEYKGASTRRLTDIMVPKGNSYLYITVENKSKLNRSVAIIVE